MAIWLPAFLLAITCFNYQNGSWETILNIYVLRDFQWFKELFNPMGFDPYNYSLKIQESIKIPTPKVRAQLGVWRFIPSHSPTNPHSWSMKRDSWVSFLARTFASPCLGHEPKVKVTTKCNIINFHFIHIFFSFHCISILIHHSFIKDYFVWHLYMFM